MHIGIANPLWRENVPGIPGACAIHNFTYLVRGPWAQLAKHRICYYDIPAATSQTEPHFRNASLKARVQIALKQVMMTSWHENPFCITGTLCVEGFHTQRDGFPTQIEGFPTQMEGFPTQRDGFSTQMEGFHTQREGFPTQMKGFPTQMEGFPTQRDGFHIQRLAIRCWRLSLLWAPLSFLTQI